MGRLTREAVTGTFTGTLERMSPVVPGVYYGI